MKSALLAAAIASAVVLTAPSVTIAQADVVAERQQVMKTVGRNTGIIGGMIRGRSDFDADAALAALQAMREAATPYATLFPEGSEAFDRSEASEAIWTNRAAFDAANAKFLTDLDTAIATAPADLDALRASFGMVGANCQACHTDFRVDRF